MCMSGGGQQGSGSFFQNIVRQRMLARRSAVPGSAGTPGVIGPSPSYPAPVQAPGG